MAEPTSKSGSIDGNSASLTPQNKDEEIFFWKEECKKRQEKIETLCDQLQIFQAAHQVGTADSIGLSAESSGCHQELSPEEQLAIKNRKVLYLRRMIEAEELQLAERPFLLLAWLRRRIVNQFAWLKRKIINISKVWSQRWTEPFLAKQAIKPAIAFETSLTEPPFVAPGQSSPLHVDQKALAVAERKERLVEARFHRLKAMRLHPPFACWEAINQRVWIYYNHRWGWKNGGEETPRFRFAPYVLYFAGQCNAPERFIYSMLVNQNSHRLGTLHQIEPRPVVMEQFPASKCRDEELPSLSIVTPSYGQAAFIQRTIDSVLNQNYPKLEYHIQDGGSNDGTIDVLRQYESRLSSWESMPDKGQSDAVIKGFKKTDGEIMAWLNSDDVFMGGALRYVGEYFASHPEVDVIYGHRVIIDEQDSEIGRWFLPRHHHEVLRWADYIPQETLFWRRRAWEKVGGLDPAFQFALDWDFLLRLQNAGLVITRVPYFLGSFRVHSSQKTSAAIHGVGQKEMDHLREREHGRAIPQILIKHQVRSYLIQSGLCELLWRIGVRL